MPWVVDNATGKVVQVDAKTAQAGFDAQQYALPKDQHVRVVGADGTIGTVPPDQVAAVRAAGGRFASDEEYDAAAQHHKYGGIGGAATALGTGVLESLAPGVGDSLAIEGTRFFGGDEEAEKVRSYMAGASAEHPYIRGGGAVLGALVPMALSGGAAAPEEAAALGLGEGTLGAVDEASAMGSIAQGVRTLGAIPRGIGAAGDAAEGLVSSVLGEGAETVLGKAAQGAAKTAARATVEGGLFGAGNAIDESELENKPLTAEKLVSSVGHGALFAGLLGGGLGGAGSLLSDGTQAVLGKLSPTLQEASEEQAAKWLDPTAKATRRWAEVPGGDAAIGRTILNRVIRPIVDKDGIAALAMDPEAKLAAVDKAADDTGKAIGAIVDGHPEATVSVGEILDPIDGQIGKYSGTVLGEDKVQALAKLKASVLKSFGLEADLGEITERARMEVADEGLKAGSPEWTQRVQERTAELAQDATDAAAEKRVSVGELVRKRRELQDRVFEDIKAMDPERRVKVLRQISGIWGDLEEQALNEATPEGSTRLGDQLKDLNGEYQRLAEARFALKTNVAQYQSNRNFSLTDYAMGLAPAVGAIAGGHPLGAATGLLTALGNRWMRRHGNAYAALMLDRLASFGGMSRAVTEVDEAINSHLEQLVGGNKLRVGPAPKIDASPERFAEEVSRIRDLSAMAPAVIGGHLANITAPIATHAPETAKAMQGVAMRGLQFLKSKAPPEQDTHDSLTPQLEEERYSAPERVRFMRYVQAVEDGPDGILARAVKGHVTDEDVETLRAVYPERLKEIQQKVLLRTADRTKPLPMQTRLRLHSMFDVVTDPIVDPGVGMVLQEAYAKSAAKPKPPPKPGKSAGMSAAAKSRVGERMTGPFDKAMGAD